MRGVALLLFWLSLVASCTPDYGHTAFRCDANHGCPDDQTCIHGRCRRAGPADVSVACGSETCDVTRQCCFYDAGPARCIPAGDICPDDAALCDGADDCQDGDRCCADSEMLACDASCQTYACRQDSDCPSTEPYCCDENRERWRECSSMSCL